MISFRPCVLMHIQVNRRSLHVGTVTILNSPFAKRMEEEDNGRVTAGLPNWFARMDSCES